MARKTLNHRQKGRRRPKSGDRMNPAAVNSWLMLTDEEFGKWMDRTQQLIEIRHEIAAERTANKARRARRPWDHD
jgi:hypothetical protein